MGSLRSCLWGPLLSHFWKLLPSVILDDLLSVFLDVHLGILLSVLLGILLGILMSLRLNVLLSLQLGVLLSFFLDFLLIIMLSMLLLLSFLRGSWLSVLLRLVLNLFISRSWLSLRPCLLLLLRFPSLVLISVAVVWSVQSIRIMIVVRLSNIAAADILILAISSDRGIVVLLFPLEIAWWIGRPCSVRVWLAGSLSPDLAVLAAAVCGGGLLDTLFDLGQEVDAVGHDVFCN